MFMGASSARVSPPFQRHVLWVARSISGFTSPKERASWKMSSPPIATARLRKAAQSSRPAVVTRSRVLDMALLLVRFAQRGGDLIFITPGRDGVAEMGFIVRHDVIDLVRRKPFQALPKSREKKRAAHGSSPSIFSTEAMKLFHSPR